MSYDTMDHVGWVEHNIAAHKRRKPLALDRRRAAEGIGWFAAPDKLNPFQRQVITILGIVGRGIYNAPINWATFEWRHADIINLTWRHEMATFDGSELTDLVMLCHEARIRAGISPAGRYLRLGFHPRDAGRGTARSHPDLVERIGWFANRFGDDHPVMYRQRRFAEWGADRVVWPAGMFGWRYDRLRYVPRRDITPTDTTAEPCGARHRWPVMRDRRF